MLDYHKSIIPRHFVRTKAVQYLYAFHINQQANYQNALEEIKAAFIPDIFAKEPVNVGQLEREKAQALNLFATWETGKIPYMTYGTDKTIAHEVASRIWEEYQLRLEKETNTLKSGFQVTLDKILDAYLLILKLATEWFVIAKDQAQKSKELSINILYPVDLAHSHILEILHTENFFLSLMLKRRLSWSQHMDTVGRWYNKFIKEMPLFHDPISTNTDDKNHKVLMLILHQIVLEQEDIQHFFNNLDLGWEENKNIIKKLLTNLDIESLLATIKDLTQFGASSAIFYTKLVESTLEKDHNIETLIQQTTKNWSIERIVLLDRIIIKLALYEMHYLPNTPIKVIINEYIDIAKKYSTLKSGAFVNGVLDSIAKTV